MDAVNVCLVGHRGVGKTSFLARVTSRATFDLDAEVARAAGAPVARLFAERGEAEFRRLERATLGELLARPGRKVVAVGAGFEGPKPAAFVLWLRRETDAGGRVFLDRPRLNAAVSPLDEYFERFAARESRFRAWADRALILPEGYDGGLEDVLDDLWRVDAEVTFKPGDPLGVRPRRLEVRDDLTPAGPAGTDLPLLRAYRTPGQTPPPTAEGDEDWALELGPAPRAFAVVSAHGGTVRQAIDRLASAPARVAKLAAEVHTFTELMEGHRWWRERPNQRAFLPRSANGRWRWYRALYGPRMPLHFVREDEGTAPDQPLIWQARLQPEFTGTFAAVLGSPVVHSRTPIEHRAFFAARGRPVVAVDVGEDEWPEAWPVLKDLGLTQAAVTAPLKGRAFAACDDVTPAARTLGAVNTLHVDRGQTFGTNTDVTALDGLARELGGVANVWLWGGGGVKAAVRQAWPGAREISARAGAPAGAPSPDLVIWAVGRARGPKLPPAWVRPRLILDLNYADDSPGLEWAAREGLAYRSGLDIFRAQASAQRAFWRAREEGVNHAWQSVW